MNRFHTSSHVTDFNQNHLPDSMPMTMRRQMMKRRTFLTAAGVSLLLPRLESLGQVNESASPRRLLTIVNHLSFYQPELIPEENGSWDDAPALLNEFSDHFGQLKIFSGLNNPAVQNGFGHTPCVGILSGYFNKLHRKNRLSIDQAIADMIGDETRFKSLVFQAGENLNFSQISWDKYGLPVHQIDSPRKIFNLLFQVNEDDRMQQQVLAEDRSILDAVLSQARSMEKRLNATDRAKMDEYLTSVREVEQIVNRRAHWANRSKPDVNYELDDFNRKSVDEYVDLTRSCRPCARNGFNTCSHGSNTVLGRLQRAGTQWQLPRSFASRSETGKDQEPSHAGTRNSQTYQWFTENDEGTSSWKQLPFRSNNHTLNRLHGQCQFSQF